MPPSPDRLLLELLLVTSAAVVCWHVIREAFNRRRP